MCAVKSRGQLVNCEKCHTATSLRRKLATFATVRSFVIQVIKVSDKRLCNTKHSVEKSKEVTQEEHGYVANFVMSH